MEVIIPDDEELKWRVKFEGPEDSIYEGEKFTYKIFSLSFTFSDTYVKET